MALSGTEAEKVVREAEFEGHGFLDLFDLPKGKSHPDDLDAVIDIRQLGTADGEHVGTF